jgi:hypothetical protein
MFALSRQASYRLPFAIDRLIDMIHPKLLRLTRILQEDLEKIGAWSHVTVKITSTQRSGRSAFCSATSKLVADTKAKYGVHNDDVHNFDDTNFQMGVISSMKVVKV